MNKEELEIKYIETLLHLIGKDKKIEELEKRIKALEYNLYLKNAGYTKTTPDGLIYGIKMELENECDPNGVTV